MGDGVRKEAYATAVAITPGFLVELDSAGKVQAHSNAGQAAQTAFAVEDDLQGKEIGDNYAANSIVQYNIFRRGDEVLAMLNDGENVAIGDFLESSGNGKVRKYAADSAGAVEYPKSIVGVAMEAVDMSDSSAADPSGRIRIEIM
jgi:hypothetical protein